MHRIHPQTTSAIAIGIPVKSSQNIFAIRLIAPPPYVTSLPNGKNASPANLKHCKPIGIPMIVIHQPIPAITHESPAAKPPNINHKIFPSIPMFLFSPLVFYSLFLFYSNRYRTIVLSLFELFARFASRLYWLTTAHSYNKTAPRSVSRSSSAVPPQNNSSVSCDEISTSQLYHRSHRQQMKILTSSPPGFSIFP